MELGVLYVLIVIVLSATLATFLMFAQGAVTAQSFMLATISCLGLPPLLMWRRFRRVRKQFLADQKRPTLRLGEAEASSAVDVVESGCGTTR